VHQQKQAAYFGAPKIRIPLATDFSYSFHLSSLNTNIGADVSVFSIHAQFSLSGVYYNTCSRAPTAIEPEKKVT